jgi:hypothetical protein
MGFAETSARMMIRSGESTKGRMAFLGALVCLAGGCATGDVGNGSYGVAVDTANRPQATAPPSPLQVSAGEVASYSTSYLGLVEVTFENRTSVWKQVDRVTVDFGSPARNQSISIASEEDIDAWERAIAISRAIAARPLATTGIEALGLHAGAALGPWAGRQDRARAASGSAPAPAAAGSEATAVAPTPSYPDQHLLTTPFRIPPGLFAKRWILLSTPDNPPGGCVDSMILSYETSDHLTGRVLLPFKVRSTAWQGPACALPPATNQDPRM